MKRAPLAALILLVAAVLPASAQGKKVKRGFVFNDRPTIVFGKDISVSVTGRTLLDWRAFDPDIGEDTFRLRAARLGLKGELTRNFDFEIEREIGADNDDMRIEFGEWKDVYGRWRTHRKVRVKAGRFKIPFGFEQNLGVSDLDFAYRALGSRTIAPARDTGLMVSGELRRWGYEAGVFDDDGDNADSKEERFVAPGQKRERVGPSYAMRVTGDLFRTLPFSGRLRSANLGFAYTNAYVPEGLNSLRGDNFWNSYHYFDRVYVKGRRQRFGTQFDWTPGPASLRAEWMQSREQRHEQSNRNEDLSDFIANAWYVSGTWFVTGEDKDNTIRARHPFLRGGLGAIELAARIEQLGFHSASSAGMAFTNPRADHLVPNTDTVFTLGVNWTTLRWTRVIVNVVHEDFEDETRTPVSGTTSFWSGVLRLNVVF